MARFVRNTNHESIGLEFHFFQEQKLPVGDNNITHHAELDQVFLKYRQITPIRTKDFPTGGRTQTITAVIDHSNLQNSEVSLDAM